MPITRGTGHSQSSRPQSRGGAKAVENCEQPMISWPTNDFSTEKLAELLKKEC
jgi:hypothetical protein